jgi:hypothetical protein
MSKLGLEGTELENKLQEMDDKYDKEVRMLKDEVYVLKRLMPTKDEFVERGEFEKVD